MTHGWGVGINKTAGPISSQTDSMYEKDNFSTNTNKNRKIKQITERLYQGKVILFTLISFI